LLGVGGKEEELWKAEEVSSRRVVRPGTIDAEKGEYARIVERSERGEKKRHRRS